jgi:glucose-1-phosphatase
MFKPKWVVFDVGGVLIDWHGGVRVVAQLLESEEESVLSALVKYIEPLELGKIASETGWSRICRDLGKRIETEKVMGAWIGGCKLVESSWRLAGDLRKAGYRLAICTNNWIGVVDRIRAENRKFALFEECIDSSVVGFRKPDQRIYEIAEEKMKAKGQEIFYIEDTLENVEAARKRGWQAYHFSLKTDQGRADDRKIRKRLVE